MPKRAQMYYRKPCPGAEEVKSFLEENGVLVMERDISRNPLTKKELGAILGYHNPRYYLDVASTAFKKNKLDKEIPERNELLDMIEENPDLLRNPIILTGRLMTFGSNRRQLIDMFQLKISDNGSDNNEGKSRNSAK